MTRAALPLLALLALGAMAPSQSQAQSVADALRAEAKPVALADLPESYRALSLGDGGDSVLSLFGLGAAFSSGSSGAEPDTALLFSAIGATWVEPDEFEALLKGERPRIRGYRLDYASVAATGGKAPKVSFIETWLEGGRIAQWSPLPALTKASLAKAVAAAVKADPGVSGMGRETSTSPSLSEAKSVSFAIQMYAQDYDERLPNAASTAAARTLVAPYLAPGTWSDPKPDGRRFLYNTYLANRTLASIPDPSNTLLLWDDKPDSDGNYAVAFADGRAKLVDATEWNRLQAAERARRDADRKRMAKGKGTP